MIVREAASVILLRRRAPSGFEVLLLRRHRAASFFASASVFPGGAADPGEDARECAARELFEEAGVLLARQTSSVYDGNVIDTLGSSTQMREMVALRAAVLAGESATTLLAARDMTWWTDVLVPWSHWITPSVEPKRFSARFFVAELPAGQNPSFDDVETVEQFWVTPEEGIARAAELNLPPPQLRTLYELAQISSVNEVLVAGHARGAELHPILPRRKADADPPVLLLPWDPDYGDAGTGDALPLTYAPRWATGPSRFVRDGNAWSHVNAPVTSR